LGAAGSTQNFEWLSLIFDVIVQDNLKSVDADGLVQLSNQIRDLREQLKGIKQQNDEAQSSTLRS